MLLSRLATTDDEPAVWGLLEAFHAECGQHRPNRSKVYPLFYQRIRADACYVLEHESAGVVGSISLETYEPWWTDTTICQDTWICISEPYRSVKAFRTLLELGAQFADARNLAFYVGLNTLQSDRKRVLFSRYLEELSQVFEISYRGGMFRK